MAPRRPLVFLLVHGIGPQNAPFQEDFLCAVRKATRRHLERHQQPALLERLVMVRADWSHLYKDERCDWLSTLYPEHARPLVVLRRKLRMLARIVALAMLPAAGVGAGVALAHTVVAALWLGALGAAAGLLAAYAAARAVVLPRFPWGDLWTMGRSFEANTISDIVLYESDGPREAITRTVLDALGPVLAEAYPVARADDRPCLPVVLAGHSLGTVIVYDALLATTARARGAPTRAQRELREDGPGLAEARRRYLERLRDAHEVLCPVGMATMGSPIALFLFRKPEVLRQRNLWTLACPPPFAETGAMTTAAGASLRWRWQNFWHAADFVAHRLGPVFNEGYPGGRFVEDVRVRPPAPDPIDAHSTYWTDRTVVDRIAAHLADILISLP